MTAFNNYHNRINKIIVMLLIISAVIIACFNASSLDVCAIEGDPAETATIGGVAGGGYEVTEYDMHAVIGKDHTYTVEENVSVNIPDTLQRIDFSIPSGTFRIRDINVEGLTFSARTASEGSSITITDPSGLSTGLHTYKITYKILEFADRDPNMDVFYFSFLLPEWRQPIADLKITAEFPEDFPLGDINYYAGQFGVQDTENRLTYKTDNDAHTVTITGAKIPENFGITMKAGLEDGYWQGALDGVWAVLAMVLIMGIVTLVLLVLWIIGGRDPRFKRTKETRPIEGVTPVDFGYIFNSELDIRDLVRLILYFATKGYLRISEYEPKRYRLVRLKDPDGEEKLFRNAYNILFEDVYKGRALEMDEIGDRLYRIGNSIRDDVAAGFSAKEMLAYTPLSRGFRIAGIILISLGLAITTGLKYSYQYISVNYAECIITGVIAALILTMICRYDDKKYSSSDDSGKAGEIIFSAIFGVLVIYVTTGIIRQTGQIIIALFVAALAGLAAFLAVIMRARGKGNAALVMRFRQLRRFIYHPTPKELLENYLADENYYYDMLIYALTFGAEETWAISFLTLDVPEPDWYVDEIEGHAFTNLRDEVTTIDYARDLRSFVRTIETAYMDMMRRRRRNA
ncbi:MAG: DUF2207 domain-containing protein [Mogibacterium sp.]|nr:DUF2207 domain-containing protein [Mogibacterium sp.]